VIRKGDGKRDEDNHLSIAADSGPAERHGVNREFSLISSFHVILPDRNDNVKNF